jgi:hypothetical protein
MMTDSNTLGWLIATGVVVYLVFKNWRRFIKIAIFGLAAMFVLFVVQIKEIFDLVVDTKSKNKIENNITYDVKAEIDSVNTVHIREVKVRN